MPAIVIVEDRELSPPNVPRASAPAETERLEADESRTVGPVAPPALFRTVSVPPTNSPRLAIVYVTPAATLESNVTVPANSLPLRFAPAKVIVRATLEVNVMGAAKFHEAEVEAFVQLPSVTLHVPPDPEVMNAAAVLILTSPVVATADVPVKREPATVTPPWAVSAKLLALVLSVPLTVSKPVTVSAAPNVLVPAPWVMLLKLCPAASVIVPVAPKTTVEVPLFNVAFAAVEVQLPLSVIVDTFAVSVPFVPIVMPALVTARLPTPVVRIVFPVGPTTLFWIVSVPPELSGFVAIVYVIPATAVVSSVRFGNSVPDALNVIV